MTAKLMRAIQQTGYGGPEVLELRRIAVPDGGPRDVLVRVHAAGVNPVDWKTRRSARRPLPFIPGWDLSGVVERPVSGCKVSSPMTRCSE